MQWTHSTSEYWEEYIELTLYRHFGQLVMYRSIFSNWAVSVLWVMQLLQQSRLLSYILKPGMIVHISTRNYLLNFKSLFNTFPLVLRWLSCGVLVAQRNRHLDCMHQSLLNSIKSCSSVGDTRRKCILKMHLVSRLVDEFIWSKQGLLVTSWPIQISIELPTEEPAFRWPLICTSLIQIRPWLLISVS